jgi:hypothetical protein
MRNVRSFAALYCALATLAITGCTWVEPDAGGKTIRVAYDEDLSHCTDLRRTITVSVKHDIAGIERNELKVRDELESLARNEAGNDRDADTVQALGEPSGGEQRFAVYRCR